MACLRELQWCLRRTTFSASQLFLGAVTASVEFTRSGDFAGERVMRLSTCAHMASLGWLPGSSRSKNSSARQLLYTKLFGFYTSPQMEGGERS